MENSQNEGKVFNKPSGEGDDPRKPPRRFYKISLLNYEEKHDDQYCNLLRLVLDLVQYTLQINAWNRREINPPLDLPDLRDAPELFRQDMGDAFIRFRNGMEFAFYKQKSDRNRNELLSPRGVQSFLFEIIGNIFANAKTQRDIFDSFLQYLALIVDMTVFLLRHNSLEKLDYLISTIIHVFERYIRNAFQNDEYTFIFEFYSFVEREHPLFVRPEDSADLMAPLQQEPEFEGFPPPPQPPVSRIEDLFEPREPLGRNEGFPPPPQPPVSRRIEDLFEPREPLSRNEGFPSPPQPPVSRIEDLFEPREPLFRNEGFPPPPQPPLSERIEDLFEPREPFGRNKRVESSKSPDHVHPNIENIPYIRIPLLSESPPSMPPSNNIQDRDIRIPKSPKDNSDFRSENQQSHQSVRVPSTILEETSNPLVEYPITPPLVEDYGCNEVVEQIHRESPCLIDYLYGAQSGETSTRSAPEVTEPPDSPLLACAPELIAEMKNRSQDLRQSSNAPDVTERPDSPLTACASELIAEINGSQSQDSSGQQSTPNVPNVTEQSDYPLLACASELIAEIKTRSRVQDSSEQSTPIAPEVTEPPHSPLLPELIVEMSKVNIHSEDSSSSVESIQYARLETEQLDSPPSEPEGNSQLQNPSDTTVESTDTQITTRPDSPQSSCASESEDDSQLQDPPSPSVETTQDTYV